MQWLGLSLVEASLLFGALATVLTALYLGGRNLPQLRVPYLAFWREEPGRAAGARSLRLRSPLSLLLVLAIVLLLVLALADPRFASGPGRRLVVLLDHSASMAAGDESPTRLVRAKRLVLEQLASLAPEDELVLLALADRTLPVARAGADLETVQRALAALLPSPERGDLAAGLQSAIALLQDAPRPELLLLSDGNLRGVDEAMALLRRHPRISAHQVRVGKQRRNLAVTQLAARPYPRDSAHQELLVRVHNAGERGEDVELTLAAHQTPLLRATLHVTANSTISRTFGDLVHAGERIEARISASPTDPLPSDDQREATLPERKRTRVLASSPGNRYLEAALLLDDYLDVSWVRPGAPFDARQYDIAIFDAALPGEPAALPALFLAPYAQGAAQPLPPSGTRSRPFFEHWDHEHPLLHGLALGDVNLARAARTSPLPSDQILASAGGGLALIVEGTRSAQPFIALTFDVRESDLPLRAAFPLLVLSAVQRLAGPGAPPPATAIPPADDVQIEPRTLLPAPETRPAPRLGSSVWQLLLLAALLLLTAEWLTFQRRVTS